ncbi:MAG: hypothetical protein P3W93_002140 [Thermus sp.]|nr:hypothetical protein [Thermus sp.]
MVRKMKGVTGLLLLGLLGSLGGCNTTTPSSGSGDKDPCNYPPLGENTPPVVCHMEKYARKENYWALKILDQGSAVPEEPFDLGMTVGGEIWIGPWGTGPYLQFLRIPGFDQRFLVGMEAGRSMEEGCGRVPLETCFADEDLAKAPGAYSRKPILLGDPVVSSYIPAITNRFGTMEGELEWVTQYAVPRNWFDPLLGIYSLAERMEQNPDRFTGKAYTFKQSYSFSFGPQGEGRYSIDETLRDLRYAQDLDPYPVSQGGNVLAVNSVWSCKVLEKELGWPCPDKGNMDRAWRAQFRWTNLDYYAFRYASGHVSPMVPLCAPGVGWYLRGYFTEIQLRNEPFDLDTIRKEVYDFFIKLTRADLRYGTFMAASPYWPYNTHMVYLVGQDIVGYVTGDSGTIPFGSGSPSSFSIPMKPQYLSRYPVKGWKTEPPGRTLRVAVLYRDTITKPGDWRPSPTHPYGEDNWHLVWSDVYLGGTLANPDCKVKSIGYHIYDLPTSARLDEFFGLEDVPVHSTINPYFTVPILKRIGVLNVVEDITFALSPGELQLPDWATPPGW